MAFPPEPSSWPVLKTYDAHHLLRIAMPIGGIGTGTVSLGGRGNLQDWEVVNRPAKGFNPKNAFFTLYARPEGGAAVTRALEGPLDLAQYEGAQGSDAPNHSLPRFRECQFQAAYPLAQVLLSDPTVPVRVRLQAFNPLIPPDADDSGIPIAVLRYVLTNPTIAYFRNCRLSNRITSSCFGRLSSQRSIPQGASFLVHRRKKCMIFARASRMPNPSC